MRSDILYLPPITARDLAGDIRAQTRDALAIAGAWLDNAGSSRERLLVAHIWLRDMSLFSEMTAEWNAWVTMEALPSRSCVSRPAANPDVLVELEFTALKPAAERSSDPIERYGLIDGPNRPRMCLGLAYDDWVTVCLVPPDTRSGAADQTVQILELFDQYLSAAGTDKRGIQLAQIWIACLDDFDAVKRQLDKWLVGEHQPAITCMRADMAKPEIAVEIRITAAR